MAGYYDGNGTWVDPEVNVLSPAQIAKVNATMPVENLRPAKPGTIDADDKVKIVNGVAVPGSDMGNSPDAKVPVVGAPPSRPSVDVAGLAASLAAARDADINKGLDFGSKYFGAGNPDMAAILQTRKDRALGLNKAEVQGYRDRGTEGINQEFATAMRGLRGMQATSGVRGGAASAQAIPIVQRSLQQRGALERDIGLADMERRSNELSNYEKSLTGERAGLLGTGFGFAGAGASDRSSALQYGLGQDFLGSYEKAAGAKVNTGGDKPFDFDESMSKWGDNYFDPGKSPWQQFAKDKTGVDFTPFKYSDYMVKL